MMLLRLIKWIAMFYTVCEWFGGTLAMMLVVAVFGRSFRPTSHFERQRTVSKSIV